MSIHRLLVCLALAGSLCLGLTVVQAVAGKRSAGVQSSTPGSAPAEKVPDLAAASQRIIDRTNAFRQAEGLGAVEPQPQLGNAAQGFADYMARTDQYGHTADGKTPGERAQEHGYEYCLIAENIAYQAGTEGFTTEELAQGFVEGWKGSREHRQNMRNAVATDIGVGVARREGSGNYYAVQMFGRPKSQMLEFQISNRSGAAIEYEVGGQTLPLPPQSTRTHQMCELAKVTVRWPNAQEPTAVQPGHGDHYTVSQGEAGGFKLEQL
jgi:uncharacterized protein YkwD